MRNLASKELVESQVLDEQGQSHSVGELWQKKTAVILWVRHFGCIACAAQVEEFKPEIPGLLEKGIAVSIIGSGAYHYVEGFKERLALDVPVYSDEKLASYRALQMRRGLRTMLDPRMLKNILWPFKYKQGKIMGDPLQQGGVLVVRPDGRITYKYISQYNGDHPSPQAISAAALQAD